MSIKHPKLTAKELIKIVESKGFYCSRQKGSHMIFMNSEGLRTTIPDHNQKELGIGLLKQIMKDTGLTIEDLKK
jgi:predicted RNA binding protein YcfA (HicA-like mRNA interferase family)